LCLAPARLEAAPTASETIRHFYDVLLETMKNAEALGAKGRFDKLHPVIEQVFDLPFMTKMSVGATWGKLSPEQKQRAASAFTRYVAATYSRQFDDYSGEKLEVLGEQKVPHSTVVRTEIVQPDGEKHSINYVMHDNGPANAPEWQIRDIYLAGSISELATRRSDFTGTLRHGGIEALIAQLNKKADDLLS
jgi:phospholipid transport system substrate-binding protein